MSLQAYVWIAVAVGVVRLVESAIGAVHLRWIRARGGSEIRWSGSGVRFTLQLGLIVACILEADLSMRLFQPLLGWTMLAVVAATIAVRWCCIAALGKRWTIGVVLLPGIPPVHRGPYRWSRRPADLAAWVQGVALALVWGSWITAVGYAVLHPILVMPLALREERFLAAAYPS